MAAAAEREVELLQVIRLAIDDDAAKRGEPDVGRRVPDGDGDPGAAQALEELLTIVIVHVRRSRRDSCRAAPPRALQSALASRSTSSQMAWLIASSG